MTVVFKQKCKKQPSSRADLAVRSIALRSRLAHHAGKEAEEERSAVRADRTEISALERGTLLRCGGVESPRRRSRWVQRNSYAGTGISIVAAAQPGTIPRRAPIGKPN